MVFVQPHPPCVASVLSLSLSPTTCFPLQVALWLSVSLSLIFSLSPFDSVPYFQSSLLFCLSSSACLVLTVFLCFPTSLLLSMPLYLSLSLASLLFLSLSSVFLLLCVPLQLCLFPSASLSFPDYLSPPFTSVPSSLPFWLSFHLLRVHIASASDAGKQSHLQRVSTHAWHDFLLLISVSRVTAAATAAVLGQTASFAWCGPV